MKKILIIRFSSIGDIVLTSPIIRCLYEQLNADIHYLTKKNFEEILKANPYIKKVWTIQEKVSEVASELKKESFDCIIDLHKNIRSQQIRTILHKTNYISFDKLNLKKWLLVNFKLNFLPQKHLVDRYFEALSQLNVINDEKGLDFFINDSINTESNYIHFKNELKNKKYICLVVGAAHFTKRLPISWMVDLITQIEHKTIVLLGGENEKKIGENLYNQCPNKIINTTGLLSINASAAIIKEAQAIITPDTGMMHIAAAFEKKTISIWGSTVTDFGMYPYLRKDKRHHSKIVQNQGLSCRPCSKIGKSNCPKKHFKCMKEIDINEVLLALK